MNSRYPLGLVPVRGGEGGTPLTFGLALKELGISSHRGTQLEDTPGSSSKVDRLLACQRETTMSYIVRGAETLP